MKKTTKIAIGVGFALAIGALIYFLVKSMKKDKETTSGDVRGNVQSGVSTTTGTTAVNPRPRKVGAIRPALTITQTRS